MTGTYPLDYVPLWLLFPLWCVLTFAAIEIGLWVGKWRRSSAEHDPEGPFGTVVGAVLGLLAFMLAIAFGATSNRYDTRKQLLLDEVNAIGTAYLRGSLLLEPHKTETRRLLREYIGIRVQAPAVSQSSEQLQQWIQRAEAVQRKLWTHAIAIADADRSSEIDSLFISALNGVIEVHAKRVVYATQYRIPLVVWSVLAFVSVLAAAKVGFQFGLSGRRSLFANVSLALTFSAVIFLIHDLDRPHRGGLTVNQQPMIELQQKMGEQVP
jgi:hypothetical protein